MKVLVTGGSGFVGSHLIDVLIAKGYETINLDLVPSKQCSEADFLQGDVCSSKILRKVIERKPEIIVHLAAKSRYSSGLEDPIRTFNTNAIGTLKLLETVKKINTVGRFIYISSEQAYGKAESFPIDENHPLRPYSVYGSSKAAADILARTYADLFPVVILRPGMGFGPRSPPSQVVTKFFLRAMTGKPLLFDPVLRENASLSPTRDCNYISNIIDGFMLALEKDLETGSIFNIGSGFEISILDLGKKIAELTGGEISFSENYCERPGELGRRFLLDILRAKKLLGYGPKVSLEKGLRLTLDWLKENGGYFD